MPEYPSSLRKACLITVLLEDEPVCANVTYLQSSCHQDDGQGEHNHHAIDID